MDIFQAIFLALVQGITEFLPVSSSGHLILASNLIGWADQGLAFDVAVHLGSLVAVIIFFRKDLTRLTISWLASIFKRHVDGDAILAWQLVVVTIPTSVVAWVFSDFIEMHFRSLSVVASATIFFGLLLGLADISRKTDAPSESLSWRDSFLLGCAQICALVPGASRSGVTMAAALALGYSRNVSARFSFLMAVPIIFLSGVYKTTQSMGEETLLIPLLIGVIVSAISAYFCIGIFLRFIQRIGMIPFVIYRLILGSILLFVGLN